MAQKLQQQLRELGSKLQNPLPTSKDALVKLLKQAATCLSELDQSPSKSVLNSMQPLLKEIVKPELLKHQDREVKLLVATCVCEITRITAPEAPYDDDVLKDIFQLIVSTFSGLSDAGGPSFGRRVVILETLARYRSCVVMLDLECDDLVNQMFSTFFAVASDEHPETVLTSMKTVMAVLFEESEDISEDLLLLVLSVLGRNRKDVSAAARRLAMNVIEQCAGKLESGINQFLISSMSGDSGSSNFQIDYHEVIYDIYSCAPQILTGIVPYLAGELLTDQQDIRVKAVELVGDLFALPRSAIPEAFQPLCLEFLKRLTDRVVEVRMSVLEHVRTCLLSNPSRVEAPQIISALCDRLLDYDENIRKQVVAVVCDVACHALTSISVETVKLVAERLRDKSLLVKNYTMERLAEIYRTYCSSCGDGLIKNDEYDWIPGKILRCLYDKDFRSDTIEPILSMSLFPAEFSVKQKIGNWVRIFSMFDKVEVKALEKILEQKQRLQQEMQRYLSLRQMHQDGDTLEFQKKVAHCFRFMSRCFMDPAKAEENYHVLHQVKDSNIWKILTILLDPNTSSNQACASRDELLKILSEKHRLYEFLNALSMKCSYILFNKEHVQEILLEADRQKSAGSTESMLSCMNILVILAHFSPLLLSGIEENLVRLLEEDNEIIKEGVLHILAKAGGTIREQLGVSSSSLDLILERICLEGSRKQAKYAVHALASVTKDDGLMSLSVLYKKLVDMLEGKMHLPAVLQSLGCIAQTAMPVFETREGKIEGFIKRNILECSHRAEDTAKECWDGRSELCSLKIFGIKMFVKSYLPVKDAHLRAGIDDLIGILRNILSFGEISKDIESSPVDKAHLKLAAAKAVLRLSKHWDHMIPIDVYYLTLRTSEVNFPQVKRLFLAKIYQYIKDRMVDPKYACAFLIDIESQHPNSDEENHNFSDIIQMCLQGKTRQFSLQSDANSSVVYPEYILPYLVHALAHHSACPDVDECKDVKAFEPIYRKLHIFLSTLLHGDEDGKSESINKLKERATLTISIFESIKHSEDTVDTQRTKNSCAISDLGLWITKHLAPKQEDLEGHTGSVSLPSVLYKPTEKKDGDDAVVSERHTWLADDNVLAYFDSLNLESNGTIKSEIAEDEIPRDSETDGNEVPLGKMLKRLKAKGAKAKKALKNGSSTAEQGNGNDIDVLKMVREINLDNMGLPSKFEPINGSKTEEKNQKKKTLAGNRTDVPVPKRRRSSSANSPYKLSLPKSISKGSVGPPGDNMSQDGLSSFGSMKIDEELDRGSGYKKLLEKNASEPAESYLLLSFVRKNSNSSLKQKHKSFDKGEHGKHEVKPKKLAGKDSTHTDSNAKSVSPKKRKRRSIAGLAKCTMMEGESETMDLIGCRIKVWWPMDKKYYEGVVKSYDHQKRKHVVLYDDGDVEVLRLDKERWELVDHGRKPIKRLKSSEGSSSTGVSPERKKKSLSGPKKNEKATNISLSSQVRGKRTPRKNLLLGQKIISKKKPSIKFWDAENEESADILDAEPAAKSKVDLVSDLDHIEVVEKCSTAGKESKKDAKSLSERKQTKDVEDVSGDTERGEKESDFEDGPHHALGSDEEELTTSGKRLRPDAMEENVVDADQKEKSNSLENQAEDLKSHPVDSDNSSKTLSADDSEDVDLSDDEPLSMWKRKVGKPVEGK